MQNADNTPDTTPEKGLVPGDPAVKARRLVTILCVANLALLAIIIIFQVKIVSWQSSITGSLRKLETEVNQEKVKRMELGENLLKKIDELTAPQPTQAMVAADTPVLAQPHAKAKIAGQLKKGDLVTVEESLGEWRKIFGNGQNGWVQAGWLK